MPRFLPAGPTLKYVYVLSSYASNSLPYHVTGDDGPTTAGRLEVERIGGHQPVLSRSDTIAVICHTHS